MTEIVKLYETNKRYVASTLRNIADGIDRGEYGDVQDAALVLNGDGIEVFGMGEGDVGNINLLFDAAKLKFSLAILRE